MRGLFIAALCVFLVGSPPAAKAQDATHGMNYRGRVQIITADEIAQSGAARLSDILALVDDWYTYSIEGYTWSASANGLAPPQRGSWLLLVDGNPVDLTIFGTQNINTLPLHASQIDYVEVISEPSIQYGIYAAAGVLHLHTRRTQRGVALRSNVSAGNETGDPGPFRYTELATENVDRIGPLFLAEASAGAKPVWMAAGFKADEFHGTDAQQYRRVLNLYEGIYAPRLILAATGISTGIQNALGEHFAYAGYTHFQDLFFFAPFGREVPVIETLAYGGLNGDSAPGRHSGLHYNLSFASVDLNERQNKGQLDFDWGQSRLKGNVESRAGNDFLQTRVGAGIDFYRTRTGYPLSDPSVLLTRTYAALSFRLDPALRQELSVHVSHGYDQLGVRVLSMTSLSIGMSQQLQATFSLARGLPEEENSLWQWMQRGYLFPAVLGADITLPDRFQAPQTRTADLTWNFQPSESLDLHVSGLYRYFDNVWLERYNFGYTYIPTLFKESEYFDPQLRIDPDAGGKVIGASTGLGIRLSSKLTQRIHYGYTRPFSTDTGFWETWSNVPWHRITYTARFVPLSRFSLFTSLRYQAPTQWPAYQQADLESSGRYPARLPAVFLWDTTVQKCFWGDRIRATLSLQNLLNQRVRLHPAGAVTRMSLFAGIQLQFSSNPSH